LETHKNWGVPEPGPEACPFGVADDFAAQLILYAPRAVIGNDKSEAHLDPVVRQPPIDARARIFVTQEVPALQLLNRALLQLRVLHRVLFGGRENDLFRL